MLRKEAAEEYAKALREGQREYRECSSAGQPCHPLVLDEILPEDRRGESVDVGLVDIPCGRIVGVKSAGRVSAFSPNFRPLLEVGTEFGMKWVSLCAAHLGDEGIREPIECFEYLGNFYVQEGNKRVSVLRHFNAAKMPANVTRILPAADGSPRVKAYNEFLDFYKLSGMYDLQFTQPGNYAKLLEKTGFPAGEKWTEEQCRSFRAGFHYFREALKVVGGVTAQPEDALLLWLELHSFAELKAMPSAELKKSLLRMRQNILAASEPEPLVKTEPLGKKGIITQLLKGADHVAVAFVHQYHPDTSNWTRAHELGRRELEAALGKDVTTCAYYNANSHEEAEALIEQAVAEGAELVFTTSPQLISPCMKASLKYPRVRFLNCSLHQPYASVRTYYSRIYEGKFITGAIAGAMSRDGRIGYIGSYPIHGVPASINAFALGAQLTNPNAKIELRWSCMNGNPVRELLERGVRIISNRDTPVERHLVQEYGTYIADEDGQLTPLASPTWVWGRFYENVVRSVLDGSWETEKADRAGKVINIWWGMRSNVIDVTLSPELPEGLRVLADTLKANICSGALEPFKRRIVDQQGRVRNDGSANLSPLELIKMDWLCENVTGRFPKYGEIISVSRPMVDLLGIEPSLEEAKKK